jgi:aquaporin-4
MNALEIEMSATGTENAVPYKGSLVQYHQKRQVIKPKASESDLARKLGVHELQNSLVYQAAIIEFFGTTFLIFASCASTVAIIQYGFSVPPLLIAIVHIILLALIIFATAKSSGGHVNPLITFSTMVAGLTSPARAMLYLIAQIIGSIVGASLLHGILGGNTLNLGACALGHIPQGRALIAEAAGSAFMLFVVFGTALDAGQREIYGPVVSPFFASFSLGLIIFFGGGLVTGFSGPIANPARCFGPAVVSGMWYGQVRVEHCILSL